MLQAIRFFTIVCLAMVLLSWGEKGHRTIALIAERHLKPQAKQAIQNLLGNTNLAEISTWADDVTGEEPFVNTASWHYLNLPEGLSGVTFQQKVLDTKEENIYSQLLAMEKQLQSQSSTHDEKMNALKFIVHFVGDMHQPMHVGRKKDRGGNKIHLIYQGKKTNLHALWDSNLFVREGLTEEKMVNEADKATEAQIAAWQRSAPMTWLWESYQMSDKLYTEKERFYKKTIPDDYYYLHIFSAEERLEQAGVRLAGLLNQLFSGAAIPATDAIIKPAAPLPVQKTSIETKTINLQDVKNHVGEMVTVCGVISGEKNLLGMKLLDIGAAFPNQSLTLVLKEEALTNWRGRIGMSVCISGKIISYKGKPEIIATETSQISAR